jgi:hypothetical protein
MKTTRTKIKIIEVNFFGKNTGTYDYNAKVRYAKNGKSYIAHIYVSYLIKKVIVSYNQPKECKVFNGLEEATAKFLNIIK